MGGARPWVAVKRVRGITGFIKEGLRPSGLQVLSRHGSLRGRMVSGLNPMRNHRGSGQSPNNQELSSSSTSRKVL